MKKIYCEMAFWDGFVKSYPKVMPLPTDEAIKKQSVWIGIYTFLGKADISFDCAREDYIRRTSVTESSTEEERLSAECLKLLYKKHAGGNKEITFGKDSFVQLGVTPVTKMTDQDFCAVYLTKDFSHAAKDFGVINITSTNFPDFECLFKDNGEAIAKGEDYNWGFLQSKAKHNCNSIIIADNYILKKQSVKKNLFEILNFLLPDKIDIPFHFTIISTENNIGWRWEEAIVVLEEELKRLRPKLTIVIDPLWVDEKEIHDRTIITNNIWISCGGGFDLFFFDRDRKKSVAGKSTTVNIIYPFLQNFNNWVDDAYLNNLEDVKYAFEDFSEKPPKNRLLSIIETEK